MRLDDAKTNEQIFIKIIMWVGPGQRKKLLIFFKDLYHLVTWLQKIINFQRLIFDISSKVMTNVGGKVQFILWIPINLQIF